MLNLGCLVNAAFNVANLPTGGNIGTAAATVDKYTTFAVAQTTAGQTVTVPSPTTSIPGQEARILNTGSASFILLDNTVPAGGGAIIIWNGSAWVYEGPSAGSGTDVQVYSTPGTFTWTKPPGCKAITVMALGAGGGGGSGRRSTVGIQSCGGGSGASGRYVQRTFQASDVGATVSVTCGAGGAGGASTADSTNGNNGVDGGNSTFGSIVTANGGGRGGFGQINSGGGAGTVSSNITGPWTIGQVAGVTASNTAGAGTTGPSNTNGGPSSGGSGGGFTTANAVSNGGAGGAANNLAVVASTAGGLAGGGNGNNYTFGFGVQIGTGGGGGGGATVQTGGNGGRGAGGGGGCGARDASGLSNAGGNGGDGWVVVIAHC